MRDTAQSVIPVPKEASDTARREQGGPYLETLNTSYFYPRQAFSR